MEGSGSWRFNLFAAVVGVLLVMFCMRLCSFFLFRLMGVNVVFACVSSTGMGAPCGLWTRGSAQNRDILVHRAFALAAAAAAAGSLASASRQ